jgi:hypothetical protein
MVSLSVEITGGTGRPDLSQAEHVWSREQQDGILETNMQAGNGLVDRAAFIVSRRQSSVVLPVAIEPVSRFESSYSHSILVWSLRRRRTSTKSPGQTSKGS